MDSLTHGLTAAIVAYALGLPGLTLFAVAGSMIVDADVLFARAFDRNPERYLFTHGGIAHSLAGGAVMALPAWAVVAPAAGAGLFPPAISGAALPAAFAAALAGAYLHLGLDWLACPGLPLFAPR
ncbi:MAG TPA: metal-dependent hydrolase, partial [Methanoregulaceae archaeon]|nr:metal-dependent hydrolase [Methanoregulaceae archaeon]